MFTDPCAAAGGRVAPTGWVAEVLGKVFLFRTYVPVLLGALSSADADFYLDLCQHRERWLVPLSRLPQTLIHGDIRRANVAALPSGISLFDWDFACRAPAAADLAWYWLLHFWCYPPARRACSGGSRAAQGPLRGAAQRGAEWAAGPPGVRARLGALLAQGARAGRLLPGRPIGGQALGQLDRSAFERAWELSWLKVFAQIGFCLADPLVGKPSADDIARVKALCAKAIGKARRIMDAHAG